ncbi:unnamed protein product, partial [Meganyctiphanes norvegica]
MPMLALYHKELVPSYSNCCLGPQLNTLSIKRIPCRRYLYHLGAVKLTDLIENTTRNPQSDTNIKGSQGVLIWRAEGPNLVSESLEITKISPSNPILRVRRRMVLLSELQADDFHLDRALFFACRYDREQFCENVRAGDGKVYKCLMKHKTERKMSTECADQLTRRQELVAQDYRVSKGLVNACRQPIKENFCRRGAGDDEHDVKLSKILLCLESALRKGKHLEGSCQEEMLSHRRMLMEDYKLSPDLVVACREEFDLF